MSNWKDLTNTAMVMIAADKGWEIEERWRSDWRKWMGRGWNRETEYRGRPAQPKKVTVTSKCWRHEKYGSLSWGDPSRSCYTNEWQRFPAGDLQGEVEE
jgi:hypothetical protein